MEVSGKTRPFAVLGHPIGHSLSPRMHNAAFRALGMDAVYLALDVVPARLSSVLPAMADMGFVGVNLTVPLKEAAFRCIEELSESARALGAVNTVEFLRGGLRGHNTDGLGFLSAMREVFGCGVDGRGVFVLGAGGAGRAVAITCALNGAAAVVLADTAPGRAREVAEEIGKLGSEARARVMPEDPASWPGAARENDVVVQATPVGMNAADRGILPAASFRAGQFAFDLIYNRRRTPFMDAAARGGAKAANGLSMLLHQGAAAFRIWNGLDAPLEAMREALDESVYGKMDAPGRGKA